jgi:DNA replication and repair protein RecF
VQRVKVLRLAWKNYRNLCEGEIRPCETVNVIYGQNAQGKTNLLEAMWLFTGGRSFRGAKDAELVSREKSESAVKLDFYSGERGQNAEIKIIQGHRAAELNGIPKKSCSELIGAFCAVIFSPEHIPLVSGAPVLRRNFIDSALCQCKPGYAGLLANYNRALFQRNALLKDIPRHSELLDTLDVWDSRLAALGEKVVRMRTQYLERLSIPAGEMYAGICGGKENMVLQYQKSADHLQETLFHLRGEDIASGHTGAGPHRDDIGIEIDSLSARNFASQGQKRSAVLALKLAEAQLLAEANSENPVIFLDDVLSELDSGRQDYLLNHLGNYQVFITCCEPDAAGRLKNGKLFRMSGGIPTEERSF